MINISFPLDLAESGGRNPLWFLKSETDVNTLTNKHACSPTAVSTQVYSYLYLGINTVSDSLVMPILSMVCIH